MSQEFKIEIISPDKRIFSGNADEATLPCFEGQVTVLKDHIPLITFLRPGIIEIGKNEKFYTEDGTVEFSDNNLLITSAEDDWQGNCVRLQNDIAKTLKDRAGISSIDATDLNRNVNLIQFIFHLF